jgi:hypothetical protein
VRLEAPAGLTVTISDDSISATVIDIGLGGVGLLANFPLTRGVTYGLTLRLGSRSVECEARTAHCRRRETGQWLAGLEFVRDDRMALVEQFVAELTARQIELPWPRLGR